MRLLGLEELCLVLTRSELPSVLFRGDGDLITKRSKSSCRQELFSLTKSKLEGHLLSCWGTRYRIYFSVLQAGGQDTTSLFDAWEELHASLAHALFHVLKR